MRKTQAPILPEMRGAMSPASASVYLDISTRSMARLLATGAIPSAKLGKLRRVRRADLDAYLEEKVSGGGDDA